MSRRINRDVYSKYYNATTVHIPWIKDAIKKNGKLKIDVDDLPKYFGQDMTGDLNIIREALQKLLFKEGISVSIIYGYEKKYVEFENYTITLSKETDTVTKEMKDTFHKFLEDNKLYLEDNKYLVCPECNRYNVEFSISRLDKKWWCNHCLKAINYYNYDLEIEDKDKYHIYKLWGADALSVFTNDSIKNTVKFIASYFKGCCVTKKDKCLYFDFFKENEEKEGSRLIDNKLS